MLKNLYTKIAGDPSEKSVKAFREIVNERINPLEPELQSLSDDALRAKTEEFRGRLAESVEDAGQAVTELRAAVNSEADADERRAREEELKQTRQALVQAERAALDEILPEAFASVREASVRTLGLRHFDVQMIGGMVLHDAKVAEMKTGEGKTLVATLPLYLNALLGRGVHLVTVNDYLARRDAQWMGPIYQALGLSVGVLQQGEKNGLIFDPSFKAPTREMDSLRPCRRAEAYAADITYGTNSEFGFDYLRDNMAWRLEDRVQRELHYAIVDEVDNILIDEARTPLIISGPAGDASAEYNRLADIVRRLAPDDYTIDQRTRGITLTEAGYDRAEQLLGVSLSNPDRAEESDPQQEKLMHHLEAALKAEYLFKRDKDYIVRKGQVIIVDEFTGRLMAGRRWSDGLHQAVEAKEHVPIQPESVTYATVTLQNFFRMYQRLAGMTGTAKTEEEELQKVYNLDVVVIPTNKEMIRADQPDQVYRNEEAKWRAVTIELVGLYARGQPTLIGTTSVELSEHLSGRFSAPKLQLLARARLLQAALDASREVDDKQRGTLRSILSRSLEDASENSEEVFSSRLFHSFDLKAVAAVTRKLNKDARELARIKARLAGKVAKESSNVARQFNLGERELNELEQVGERDLRFAIKLEELHVRPDSAETLCEEIAARPDDLPKTAQKFNLPLQLVVDLYQETRLTRGELNEINRALIDSCGDAPAVQDRFRVRPIDMDAAIKRLVLREEDVARLAKKLDAEIDPFAPENQPALAALFGVQDPTVLSDILHLGIPHNVLNAKEHEKEAGIIARAGEPHAITLATNMAGRGVDIKLGGELPEQTLTEVGRVLHKAGVDPYDLSFDQIKEAIEKVPPENYELDKEHVERFLKYMNDRAKVREFGGLRIIGTERHEARRIDNQLRGRSGRQGDRGSSRFYVSLEDEIMRRMGGKGLVDRVWVEDVPIEHDWVTRAIEAAQVKMESYNFDIRKHLLDYDDVLNKQREVIYGQRYRILTKADLREDLRGWLEEEVQRILAEDLKAEHGESRLLIHLDTMLPGFFLNETELWPPFSLNLVQRGVNSTDDLEALKDKVVDAAQQAMELHRDFLTDAIVPEIVNTFEAQYRSSWDEIEDLAKNTLTTIRQEAEEQNRRPDARTVALTLGQTVGMALDVRRPSGSAGNSDIGEDELLEAVHRSFNSRFVDQVYHRAAKRAGIDFAFGWRPEGELDFGALREELAAAIDEAYTKQAERFLADIEREVGERVKSIEDVRGHRLSQLMFGISHTPSAAFDQRTHRRYQLMVPRFPWTHLAASQIKGTDDETLKNEILEYWKQSLDQSESLRGGAAPFNDLVRELMLNIVTNQWVDYLTAIEALREGIGLQAFGQRNPLVEYQSRAYAMFQDLSARIRSLVVTNVFTYQYRGFAKLESEDRDRTSGRAVQAPAPAAGKAPVAAATSSEIAKSSPRPAVESKGNGGSSSSKTASRKPEPARKPTSAAPGAKLGRNDPCWCGSGKKYKNCHMQSDMK